MSKKEGQGGTKSGRVSIVGAGPGDPEMLTLKAQRLLLEADTVLYPGSLIKRAVACLAGEQKEVLDTAPLTLEEILDAIESRYFEGKNVVRLVAGDPALFSALHELSGGLKAKGIPFEVVPGVSSVFAAAARLQVELTVPELCQSVVVTRLDGRTPVPEGQQIEAFAKTGASVVLFLSAGLVGPMHERLIKAFGGSVPAVIAYRVGYEDEKVLRTTVAGLKETLGDEGISRHALLLIGEAFGQNPGGGYRSKLYDPVFGHGYRSSRRH